MYVYSHAPITLLSNKARKASSIQLACTGSKPELDTTNHDLNRRLDTVLWYLHSVNLIKFFVPRRKDVRRYLERL